MDSGVTEIPTAIHDRILRRRDFLGGLGALALVPGALAEKVAPSPISVAAINHTKIRVSDPARSLEWYQNLFGLPIVARQGKTVILRIGDGPQFLAIDGETSRKPGIVHMGLSIEGFDAQRVLQGLKTHRSGSPGKPDPIKARIQIRGPELGGDPSGTPELFLEDPDGITVQLQDKSYCGGGGKRGDQCLSRPKPAPKKRLLDLRDYNHFTTFVGNRVRTVAFYRQLFQMPIDTWQGEMPLLRVGSGNQFLAFVGAGGRGDFRPYIHHVCFTVNEFDPEKVLDALADFGIKRRGLPRGPVKPLQSYVTMRMPNRGGALNGTPELYFTDPDGILLQIQDVRYSGGSGYLGDQRGTSSRPSGGNAK
jgi:catechol 2,3-dioxygenase-like lactoylglutathione lyase family enzyme